MKPVLTFLFCVLPFCGVQAQDRFGSEISSIGDPVMFDSYGKLPWEDERIRLDSLAYRLKSEPDDIAYLYAYAGKHACLGEVEVGGVRTRDYLVKKHKIEPGRIIWKDAGHRQEFTVEIWVRPRGAPEPYASPTVDRSGAQFRDCKSRNRRRRGKS